MAWLKESPIERYERRSAPPLQSEDLWSPPDVPPPPGVVLLSDICSPETTDDQLCGSEISSSKMPNNAVGGTSDAVKASNVPENYENGMGPQKYRKLGLQYHDLRCTALVQSCNCFSCSIIDPQFERQAVDLLSSVDRIPNYQIYSMGTRKSRASQIPYEMFPSATADFLEDCRRHFSKCFGFVSNNLNRMSSNRMMNNEPVLNDSRHQTLKNSSMVNNTGHIDPHLPLPYSHPLKYSSIGNQCEYNHDSSSQYYDGPRCPCGSPLLPDGSQTAPNCLSTSHVLDHSTKYPADRHFITSPPYSTLSHSSPQFPIRTMNIVDPLQPFNNLGRSVSTGNFYRITESFKRSVRILETVIGELSSSYTALVVHVSLNCSKFCQFSPAMYLE